MTQCVCAHSVCVVEDDADDCTQESRMAILKASTFTFFRKSVCAGLSYKFLMIPSLEKQNNLCYKVADG